MQGEVAKQDSKLWKLWEKVKKWLTEIPGHNIGWALIAGGLIFQLARDQGHITLYEMLKNWTVNLGELQKGNLKGLFLSPFAHYRWDTLLFSSITLALTAK